MKHGFGYHQSLAIAKTDGHCAYRDVDVLSDAFKTGYAVDHILGDSAFVKSRPRWSTLSRSATPTAYGEPESLATRETAKH